MEQQQRQQQQAHTTPCGGGSGIISGSSAGGYDAVRAFCLARRRVSMSDVLARFYDTPLRTLDRILHGLRREGVLQVWCVGGGGGGVTGAL